MNINLLPWREKRQHIRQKLLFSLALLLFIASIITSFYVYHKVRHQKRLQERKITELGHQLLTIEKQIKSQTLSSNWQSVMRLIKQWNRITQQHQTIHCLLKKQWQHVFPSIKIQQIQLSSSVFSIRGQAITIRKLHQFLYTLKKNRALASFQLIQIHQNAQHHFDFLLQTSQP